MFGRKQRDGHVVNENMRLYHGTGSNFERPDIRYCKSDCDFGKGFYATPDPRYAWKHANHRVSSLDDYFWVNQYDFNDELADEELVVKEFDDMRSWAQFVVENRLGIHDEFFDVAIGPSADDDFNAVVNYCRYYYERGMQESIDWDWVIDQFRTHLASDQIVFATERSLDEQYLKYRGHVKQHARSDVVLGFYHP